ncbi:MAG: histidine phosphatase family protein [Isosphaeraceae bacterium]|nr:histidine phosphatase family protein [Isosphaeraceae bacterium]
MTHVVLIRPGSTVYDEQNRVQGSLDLPLSDLGRAEVAQLADRLGSLEQIQLSALYSGPSQSAWRTAESIGRVVGLRPKRIDEFRNLDQGLWQGLLVEEIRRRHQRVFRQWMDDPFAICPPQGEASEDALERVLNALRPIIRRHRDEEIGLVACEPIAQLIGAQLRGSSRVALDDAIPAAGFERIAVAPDWGRNGDPHA